MNFPLQSTFLALPLENNAKWDFQALIEELQPFSDCLRFQNVQTPHLTLQYWKEVSELEMRGIDEQAQKIVQGRAQFALKTTGPEVFTFQSEPKVLHAGIAFCEDLARLKKACPWSDKREFKPHITIARMKHPQKFIVHQKKIEKIVSQYSFEWNVDRMRLFAEVNGAKQTPLHDYVFT